MEPNGAVERREPKRAIRSDRDLTRVFGVDRLRLALLAVRKKPVLLAERRCCWQARRNAERGFSPSHSLQRRAQIVPVNIQE